jgi:hypothetical protein
MELSPEQHKGHIEKETSTGDIPYQMSQTAEHSKRKRDCCHTHTYKWKTQREICSAQIRSWHITAQYEEEG